MTQRSRSQRLLAAVLFTDIVNSTTVAEELGDRRWKTLLDRHHEIVRRELKRFGGRELDTAGDGFFASFREPASAVECACAASDSVRQLGIEIRCGVHFGECQRVGKKLAGITVAVGARLTALGGAGDVLVSSTVADLVRGAGFGLTDRGSHVLKGVEGEWRVYAVTTLEGRPRPRPVAAEEAKARRDALEAGSSRDSVRLRVAGIAVVVAAALAGLGVALSEGGKAEVPGPGTIAMIDSSNEDFDRVISVGARVHPQDLASGGDKLWVVSVTNKTLLEVNPATGAVEVFGTPSSPTGVAYANGLVWVTFGFSSDAHLRVGVLDPAETAPVVDSAPFTVPDGSYPITVAGGRVWVADPMGSTLTGYDPVTEQTDSLPLPPASGPIDIAAAESGPSRYIWIAAGRQESVFVVDSVHPKRRIKTFGTGGESPTAIAVGRDGSAWIASEQNDSVLSLTPSGSTQLHKVLGGRCDGPSGIAATAEEVWVSCGVSQTILALNPSDGSIESELEVQGSPGAVSVDTKGAVWVALHEG